MDAVLEMTGCIGFCQREPLVDVVYPNKVRLSYQGMTPDKAEAMVEAIKAGQIYPENLLCRIDQEECVVEGKIKVYANPHPVALPVEVPKYEEVPFFKKQVKIALRNCGYIHPERIEEYIGRGGYLALYKALKEMKPIDVISTVKASGLRGRGGGGFPTGMKWEFCYKNQADQKYVICNADEGDPGAFMDRGILEGDPHAVWKAWRWALTPSERTEGYVYCRAEYPLALKRLEIAIQQAEDMGLLGENIFGSDFSFRIKIREGAGAFVCGEETALIASIEGQARRTPATVRPSRLQAGLWGKPTIINNVETWLQTSPHHRQGRQNGSVPIGTEKSKGTKVFALVGKD